MMVGTADLRVLSERAPQIQNFERAALEFNDVTCFQMTAEMRKSAREAVVPPSLHPTNPATLSIQAWRVGESSFGPFMMVWARVSTRSGVRARGFSTQAYVSTEPARSALRSKFGIPAHLADIAFRHGYDGCDLSVVLDAKTILDVAAIDPEPMGPQDIQYTGSMNLAHTPMGLRLVQMEAHHQSSRVDRLRARIRAFEPASWGNALLDPYLVVSASVAKEAIVIPPIRFACKPDELAFSGTESIAEESR